MEKNKKKIINRCAVAGAIVSALLGSLLLWLTLGSYKAGDAAKRALLPDENIKITQSGSFVVFEPIEYERGFIFYPGGRVEHEAYAPLLRAIATEGWLCILVEMPFDFAFLNMNAANDARERYPSVESWVIGGHSLGGAMAASHAAKNADEYDALLLLAAYSTDDLTESGLKVISIYGENDGILNFKNYEKNRQNLPESTVEYIIFGGNHALFGDYGEQSGDGEARIAPQEQIEAVIKLMP